ncbi:hypothetical protein C8T65DRAFT_648223 [Cerioporus squamosus]|nr:hypothetical protein C8T65DRAFT_648223 [Cerioporus squamosus]
MLLLHTVLAVVYGGLLVSARPDMGRVRGDEDAELTDNPYYYSQGDVVEDDVQYNWAPDAPQLVMDAAQVPYYPDPEEVERPDFNSWDRNLPRPEVPGHFPSPPDDFPKPPEHLPHEPPHPGPPGPPPHEPGHPGPQFPGHHPHHPPGSPPSPNATIYQFLESNPRFSRIFKLVNYTEDVTKLLNDSSVNVTFFALPDWGFPRPRHSPPPPEDGEFDFEEAFTSGDDIGDVLATAEGLLNVHNAPDKDKLKALLKFVLLYQTLPSRLPTFELAKNLTHPTSLIANDGSLDGEPFRVRVGRALGPLPRLTVNLFSKIVRPNIPATNGLIHVVNKPVLPPPSAFQVTFLLQGAFATLTSALQRVGLTDAVEWRNVEGGTVDGSPAVTFFAPTNKAFQRLPRDLRLFLFSPFGEKALKKLLQYHVVPEFVLHTNYLHNASDSDFVPSEYTSECGEFYAQLNYGEPDLAELHGEARESFSSAKRGNSNLTVGWCRIPGWQQSCAKKKQRCGCSPQSNPANPAYSHGDPQDGAYDDQQQSHRFPGNQYSSYSREPQYSSHPYGGPQDAWYSYGPEPYEAYQDSYQPPPGHFSPPFEDEGPRHGPPPPPPSFVHHGPPHQWPPPPPPYQENPAYWGPPPPHHGPPPFFHHHGPPRCGPLPPPPFRHGGAPRWVPQPPPPFPPHHDGPPQFPPFPHHPPFPGHGPSPPPHFPAEYGPHHHCVPPLPPFPHHHGSQGPPPHGPPPHHFPPHHKSHFPFPPHPPIAYSLNITAPTLLTNHSLDVHVVQLAHKSPLPWKKHPHYETVVFVHGVKVGLADVPLRNGALHAIDRLLNPLKKSRGPHHPPESAESKGAHDDPFAFEEEAEQDDEWAGWQEWLPRWAEE